MNDFVILDSAQELRISGTPKQCRRMAYSFNKATSLWVKAARKAKAPPSVYRPHYGQIPDAPLSDRYAMRMYREGKWLEYLRGRNRG